MSYTKCKKMPVSRIRAFNLQKLPELIEILTQRELSIKEIAEILQVREQKKTQINNAVTRIMNDLGNYYLIYDSDKKGYFGILTDSRMDEYEQQQINHTFVNNLINLPAEDRYIKESKK